MIYFFTGFVIFVIITLTITALNINPDRYYDDEMLSNEKMIQVIEEWKDWTEITFEDERVLAYDKNDDGVSMDDPRYDDVSALELWNDIWKKNPNIKIPRDIKNFMKSLDYMGNMQVQRNRHWDDTFRNFVCQWAYMFLVEW